MANDFGIFVDVILLSIALADRMKITQEKKLIAEKEAKTDMLTGLLNRRAYYEISEMEYQKVLRYQRILSVVMFDVDEFKKINDSYGHNTGDSVLQYVAKLARETIREYDYAFRMGGDEFLLLLPETNEKQASILSERLREKIEKQEMTDSKGNVFFVTASFGVVEHTVSEICMELLSKRADEALYQAKESGRNKVQVLDKYAII
jgi:diguanylate cyclase (GGDEF)-like protein